MVLEIYKTDDGHVPGVEYLPCGTDTMSVGMVLVFGTGCLIEASPGDDPEYLSMAEEAKDGILPVVRMSREAVYKARGLADGAPEIGARCVFTHDGFVETENGKYKIVGILEDDVLVRLV